MTEANFLDLLNRLDFSQRYWDLCDRFPLIPSGTANAGRKEDVLAAFAAAAVPVRYASSAYLFEQEEIGGVHWSGVFVKQRHGIELMISGESQGKYLGSNFAVLAYDAKQKADPTFERNAFSGPAPYPRPDFNGNAALLAEIIKEHVLLVRAIKEELRRVAKQKLS